MSTAKKRRQAPPDLFDPTPAASPQAEKAVLASLLGLIDTDAAAGRKILGELSADVWTIDYGPEVFAALADAYGSDGTSVGAVGLALRKHCDERGIDMAEPKQLLADLANDVPATALTAARDGQAAAVEVKEEHARRAAILAAGAILRQLHDRTLDPDDIRRAAAMVGRVADLAEGRRDGGRELVLVRASDIECSPINWLWPQRIVGDGLTIVTGPVGISKSLISIDVAARVTTGGKWPDGTGHAIQGSVILFGAEDDPGKVVVPRLTAAGADLSRVLVCQGTKTAAGDGEPATLVLERHIGELRAALDSVADCRLIVFDPLPDYIAADENSSAEVRAALVPLAKLAQEKNVAVVAVLHQNKKADLTTVQRIAGSSAFAQIARVVLAIGTHPEDAEKEEKRRVMLVSKSNYGRRDEGQAYEIEERANKQPGLVWKPGLVTMDADSLSRRPTGGHEHEERRGDAVDALRDILQAGEQNAAAVSEQLQDAGFGRRQIDYAAKAVNVVKKKHRDGWHWRLPATPAATSGEPKPDPAFAAWAPDEADAFNRT